MIKEIAPEDAWPLRQKVMWPHKDIDYVRLPDDPYGKHYGYYIDAELISVISLFEQAGNVQFRKFATANVHQGKGYGTRLLRYALESLTWKNCSRVWCNARINKTVFYEKFGLKKTSTLFEKDGIIYVIMEKYL